MMIPTGPSPCTNGIRFSSSSANMSNGSEKASVLPEPVNAMPIMSRPEKLFEKARFELVSGQEGICGWGRVGRAYATGIPCS